MVKLQQNKVKIYSAMLFIIVGRFEFVYNYNIAVDINVPVYMDKGPESANVEIMALVQFTRPSPQDEEWWTEPLP